MPYNWKTKDGTLLGTNISPPKGMDLKMTFPFPQVGYVSSLEANRILLGDGSILINTLVPVLIGRE